MKKKEFFTVKRVLLIGALIASIFVFISSFKHNISIQYKLAGDEVWFIFDNPIWGGSRLTYQYDIFESNLYDHQIDGLVTFVDPSFYVGPVALTITVVLMTPLIAIINFISSIVTKDEEFKKISCAGAAVALFIFTIFLFMSKLFERIWLVNAIEEFIAPTNISIFGEPLKIVSKHVFWTGFWGLLAACLTIASIFAKDRYIGEIKFKKEFKKLIAKIKKLFKKKPKPAPKKKVLTEIPVEVVHSPQIDVTGEPKPVEDPEIERVSPKTKKVEEPAPNEEEEENSSEQEDSSNIEE